MLGIVILLAIFLRPDVEPPLPTPTVTPVITETFTPEPFTDTSSAAPTLTVTPSPTQPTLTPTATIEVLESLPFCTSRDIARRFTAVYVRTGPDDSYAPFGEGLLTKNSQTQNAQCLTFSTISEDGMWLLIASDQTDPALQKFEGCWIRRDLLAAGVSGSVNLPVVTLTSTPVPSDTPTITPSPTRTPTVTPSATPTETPSPTSTETSTPVEAATIP